MLAPDILRGLRETGTRERDRRIDWEAAKTRILSVLRQGAERGMRDCPTRKFDVSGIWTVIRLAV
jgi:hypothetical protein